MPYSKLCDTYAFHQKVVAAGNEAIGAHARMIAWASGTLTDGFIPDTIAQLIAGPKRYKTITGALVSANLLMRDDSRSGWCLHGYLDHNPSSQDVKDKRAEDAARKRVERGQSPRSPIGVRTDKQRTDDGLADDSAERPDGVTPPPHAGARPIPSGPILPTTPKPLPVDAPAPQPEVVVEPPLPVSPYDAERMVGVMASESNGKYDATAGSLPHLVELYRRFEAYKIDEDTAVAMGRWLRSPRSVWTWATRVNADFVKVDWLLGKDTGTGSFDGSNLGELVAKARKTVATTKARRAPTQSPAAPPAKPINPENIPGTPEYRAAIELKKAVAKAAYDASVASDPAAVLQ